MGVFVAGRSVGGAGGACGALGGGRGRLPKLGGVMALWGVCGAVVGIVETEWAGVLALAALFPRPDPRMAGSVSDSRWA